jgi:CPA1 family monovalent cation:H+ antiporter
VLVLGGLVLGFIPGLPQMELDPNLVLIIFLPPLLYWEAINAPTDVMRQNRSQIWVLAFGLVIATAVVVAVISHATISNLSWAMAFVLGAIVAPTDELAAAPVLERMRMPRHLIAIVVGESLLNDASALILYNFSIVAVVTGKFIFGNAVLHFIVAAVGGVAVGLLVGRLAVEAWRRIKDTQLQGIISFELSYLAYLLSDRFALSGVLAVVYGGIYVNRFTPRVLTPASRLRGLGYWESIVFLINAVLFLMVGIQLHGLRATCFSNTHGKPSRGTRSSSMSLSSEYALRGFWALNTSRLSVHRPNILAEIGVTPSSRAGRDYAAPFRSRRRSRSPLQSRAARHSRTVISSSFSRSA